MAKLISWKARCKICRVNKEPRLSIRKDIWILLSDTICQTQPNHLQIVRRQCCLVKGVQTRDVRVREIGFIEDVAHPMLLLARSYDEFEHTNMNDQQKLKGK